MKTFLKKVFVNKSRQIRSGWKMSLMLVIYGLAAQLMAGVAGALFSLLSRAAGKSSAWIQGEVTSGLGGGSIFMAFRTSFVAAGAAAAVIIVWRLLDGKPGRELGFTPFKNGFPGLLLGLLMGAVSISLVFAFLLATSNAAVVNSLAYPRLSFAIVTGLITYIGVGIAEESYSRGYCIAVLKQTGSRPVIIGVSSAVFALLHLANPGVSLLAVLNLFLVGVLLAVMALKTGSLWMPIGFHITWNYFQGTVYGFEVSGTDQAGIYATKLTGPSYVTGGAFGPEGGVCVTVIILICIALVLRMRDNNGNKRDDREDFRDEGRNRAGQPQI